MVPCRIGLVTLGVADVAAATAFYESLGWRRSTASVEGSVTFLNTEGPVFWGGYHGYVADLDGHLWELEHNPGFRPSTVVVERAPF